MKQNELNHGQGQVYTHDESHYQAGKEEPQKTSLSYADLLQLEWVYADKVADWSWQHENEGGLENTLNHGESTLSRLRAMIEEYPNDLIGKEGC